jgi:hypothetical protein
MNNHFSPLFLFRALDPAHLPKLVFLIAITINHRNDKSKQNLWRARIFFADNNLVTKNSRMTALGVLIFPVF